MAILSTGAGKVQGSQATGRQRRVNRGVQRQAARGLAHWFLVAVLLGAGMVTGGIRQAGAQSEPPSEYQVKAAFLYNFAKFVEWPADAFADPHAPVVLGIVGEDPFDGLLEQIVAGKTVNGRNLLVRKLKPTDDLRNFHILFIGSTERKRLPQILVSLRESSVLTVGEGDRLNESGLTIQFIIRENKVRFAINLATAARARLKISSKLLALAVAVWE